eukprot:13020176-Alexandrium_andersonii.AAC.1
MAQKAPDWALSDLRLFSASGLGLQMSGCARITGCRWSRRSNGLLDCGLLRALCLPGAARPPAATARSPFFDRRHRIQHKMAQKAPDWA